VVVRNALGNSLWLTDLVTGGLFATWLYALLHDRHATSQNAYGRLARLLASISYTLYVVHLPLLVFLRAWFVPGAPWTPNSSAPVPGTAKLAFSTPVLPSSRTTRERGP